MQRHFQKVIASLLLVSALAVTGSAQDLFEADSSGTVYEFVGNSQGTLASLSGALTAVAVDSSGDVFVEDFSASSIYELNSVGSVSVFDSNWTPTPPPLRNSGLAFDSSGDLFAVKGGQIYEFANYYWGLSGNPSVFASLHSPRGLAFDSAGDLFAAAADGGIYEFTNYNGTLSQSSTLFASGLSSPWALAFDSFGDLFETDEGSGKIYEFPNLGGTLSSNATVFTSGFNEPEGIAFDSYNDLFIGDYGSSNIYEFINNNGTLASTRTPFARGLQPYALAFLGQPQSKLLVIGSPVSTNAFVGDNVTLSVNAMGVNPLAYQWQFSGTNIPNATNSVLNLANVQLSSSGAYVVIVTNPFGSVTSVAYLEIQEQGAPTIYVDSAPVVGQASIVGSAMITMVPGFSDGFIFYTLDGSAPTDASTLYNGPFTLTNSATISAVCYSSDFSQYTMMQPVTVEIAPPCSIYTSVSGSGSVALNPAGGVYASNTVVTLTASANQYWAFEQWLGDVTNFANPLSVTLDTNLNIEAVFVPTAYTLTVGTAGGGSVWADGKTANDVYFATNSVVELTATNSAGWTFLGWQGDISSDANPYDLVITQAYNIQGIFGTSVETNAVGGGQIVLSTTNLIPFGGSVTASALADNGDYFVLWSGAASGTNSPAVVNNVTESNTAVNALFAPLPAGKLSLSVVVLGNGQVSVNPQQNYYNPGTTVTLTATPNAPTVNFYEWTGGFNDTNMTTTVDVTSNLVVYANFTSPPTVSLASTNLYVLAGSNAVLSANVSGQPPFTFQWYMNGQSLGNGTNQDYTILAAKTNVDGGYQLVVMSPAGAATSAVETVTVVFPPGILAQPTNEVVASGTDTGLTVAASGTGPFNYQWFNTSGAIINATNSVLYFSPAITNNWDNYYAVVSDPFGSVTSSVVTLVVYDPVAFVTQPASLVVSYGASASFASIASGFPPPTYQWSFNGASIAGATSNVFGISDVQLANLGEYSVLASNGYSVATSAPASLTMYPSIVRAFTGAVGIWGEPLVLSVAADGSGVLNYQWYFNGVPIAGATSPTLSFEDIQFTNAGLYSVVVSSSLGSVTNLAEQVVINPADVAFAIYPGLTISGVAGYTYTIQRSTNLADTNGWITVTNLTLTQPVQIWVDTSINASPPVNPQQFYRVLPGQ